MRISSSTKRRGLDGRTTVASTEREPIAPVGQIAPAEAVPNPRALMEAEIVDFIARIRRIPEVRINLVTEARQRVSSGYYLTREAAVQTSAEILD